MDGQLLVEHALRSRPALVILDVSMPILNGLEAARQIRTALPATKLIFLSIHSMQLYIRRAMNLGADGYVLKSSAGQELLEAVDYVMRGRKYVSPALGQDASLTLMNSPDAYGHSEETLTDRQREILQLVSEGRSGKEIAYGLGISIKTVDFHRARLKTKLGARSSAEMTRIAIEEGLIPGQRALGASS